MPLGPAIVAYLRDHGTADFDDLVVRFRPSRPGAVRRALRSLMIRGLVRPEEPVGLAPARERYGLTEDDEPDPESRDPGRAFASRLEIAQVMMEMTR